MTEMDLGKMSREMMRAMLSLPDTMVNVMASSLGQAAPSHGPVGGAEHLLGDLLNQFLGLGGDRLVDQMAHWLNQSMNQGDPMMARFAHMIRLVSTNGAELIPTPLNRERAQALANRLMVFYHFREAAALTGYKAGETSLSQALNRALEMGPRRGPWVMEGLGHALGLAAVNNPMPAAELHDPTLPESSLIPLHVGMGLALASSLLAGEGANNLEATLARWLMLTQMGARPGYLEAVREPLGLAVHAVYPHLLTPVSRILEETDEESHALLWHGVGRGIYFWPGNLVPLVDGDERALNRCLSLTENEPARLNLVAGLTWAMILVNLHQGEISARFLARHAPQHPYREAMVQGVTGAVMTWSACCPGDTALHRFIHLNPSDTAWREMVTLPATHALEHTLPNHCREGRFTPFFCIPAGSVT